MSFETALFEMPTTATTSDVRNALGFQRKAAMVLLMKLRAARFLYPNASPAAVPSLPEYVGKFQRWRRAA